MAGERWWLAAPALVAANAETDTLLPYTACYRFGEALLELAADDADVLATFERLYGDCRLDAPAAPPRLRCTLRRLDDPPLMLLSFAHGGSPDPTAAALNLLHPPRGAPRYTVYDAPLAGWRLAGDADRPVLAASGSHVLVDARRTPPDFLVEYLVSTTLAAQPELLPLHAASLRLGDAGVLVAGQSHGGKTTTTLHLAARGHAWLGDELALIRATTRELLPFRRTINVRPGPRAPEVLAALERATGPDAAALGPGWIRPLRIGALFPGEPPRATVLRAAFFLDGFAERPSVAPFRLTLHDRDLLDMLSNALAHESWGLAPERRTLRLLALVRLLGTVPSWRLTVGPPATTAELIERTVEAGC